MPSAKRRRPPTHQNVASHTEQTTRNTTQRTKNAKHLSYRQHFPEAMRSHLSHDVVLLCAPCHQLSSALDARRMRALGVAHGAPVEADAGRCVVDGAAAAARSAARALLAPKRGGTLPPERRAHLELLLARHFGAAAYDESLAARAMRLEPKRQAEGWVSHAELVVRRVMASGGGDNEGGGGGGAGNGGGAGVGGGGVHDDKEDGGRVPTAREVAAVEAFVKGWRRHFLDSMRPRFLPPHWSVDSRVANSSMLRDARSSPSPSAAAGKQLAG